MSINGVMRTAASGMSAQGSRLATVADNIANTSTTGYKRASTEFSSLILESNNSDYASGGVETDVRYAISQEGVPIFTDSETDLAISGSGFFVVADPSGQPRLTRAGSFELTGDGRLINAAGFALMGYSLADGAAPAVVNGFAGLEEINIGALSLQATPSTEGTFYVNLPSADDVVAAANLPSANASTAEYSGTKSLIAHDNLGTEVIIDVYAAQSATGEWEITAFDRSEAATGGGFPYASGPLVSTTLIIDVTTGQLDAASPTSIAIPVPNGQTLTLDMSESSQLATDFIIRKTQVNGNPPSDVERISFDTDGTVNAVFENGQIVATYKIPLANVPGPDHLQVLAGNVYTPGQDSGDVEIGFAGEAGLGTVTSGALEQSNADLASELTSMIEAQRSYTVNSRVFQTGADLLDVLVNLVR